MATYTDMMVLGLFGLVLTGIVILALVVAQGDRRWWQLFTGTAVLVLAAFFIGDGWGRRILLDGAVFLSAAMIIVQGGQQCARAGRMYLALMMMAMCCISGAAVLVGPGVLPVQQTTKTVILALVVVGFGLKLAFLPFYFWLPAVAAAARPLTTVVIVSVLDVAAFFELAHFRLTAPWVFADHHAFWTTLALASMFGGALLALGQHDLKRMLAFSSIDDMGYLLLGLTAGSGLGISGALAGAFGHSLAKLLLFGAVAVVEARLGASLTLDSRGQAARFPLCSAAFILGALTVIGVPPTLGFVGRWRLYAAGAQLGGMALAGAMMIATALAVLYYARAIHRIWLGASAERVAWPKATIANVALALLSIVVILLGTVPSSWVLVVP